MPAKGSDVSTTSPSTQLSLSSPISVSPACDPASPSNPDWSTVCPPAVMTCGPLKLKSTETGVVDPAKDKKSKPFPPSTMSLPPSGRIMSTPSPPFMVSSPSPPRIRSLPPRPFILSSFEVPSSSPSSPSVPLIATSIVSLSNSKFSILTKVLTPESPSLASISVTVPATKSML